MAVSSTLTVQVPDIGDFENVDVIEVLVAPGDRVEVETSLITLESDKATMEIPSPAAGVVRELLVRLDDQVSQGTPIAVLEVSEEAATAAPEVTEEATAPVEVPRADLHADVLVLGSGPGGYTAAFRAADLQKRVVLVERTHVA